MDLLRHELTFEEITSGIIKEMRHYWFEKRGGHLYPTMRDINLDDLPHVKPYASIVALHHPPFRMFMRFMGAQIIYFYGRDLSDHWLDDVLTGEILEDYEISHRMAATGEEPLLARSKWYGLHESCNKTYEWGMFPISENGVMVTHNILVEDYTHLNKDELPVFLEPVHQTS